MIPWCVAAAACVCEAVLKRADLDHEHALGAALLGTALALEVGNSPAGSLGDGVGIAGDLPAWPGDALVAVSDTGAAPGSALAEAATETALTGAAP